MEAGGQELQQQHQHLRVVWARQPQVELEPQEHEVARPNMEMEMHPQRVVLMAEETDEEEEEEEEEEDQAQDAEGLAGDGQGLPQGPEAHGGQHRAEQPQGQVQGPDHQGQQEAEEGLIQFTDGEDEDLDVTAEQLTTSGRDLQGIPWERLQFSREHYRATRIRQYRNYVNVLPDNANEYRPGILARCHVSMNDGQLFSFAHNNRTVTTTIVHFQLRNLVWATSRNDVFVVSQNSINHWNPTTRAETEVINLSGGGDRCARVPDMGKVQVSTLCVRDDLVATGGFGGELVVKRLGQTGWVYTGRISHSENGITNGLEICDTLPHGPCVMASNNDCIIRMYETTQEFKCMAQWEFPWAVNYASMQPGGQLVAVVGDDPVTCLTDVRTGGTVGRLACHADFSFAAAWHPAGYMLATGNQDTTTAVWDIRKPEQPLARLAGRMGAIRSLRWSPDGRVLAASEPADFVHLYDATKRFQEKQEIDLFGEISGISFTPEGDCLYIGIADLTYASLLAFSRTRHGARFSPSPADVFGTHPARFNRLRNDVSRDHLDHYLHA